jgi:RNA exonuclease 4
MDCEMVGVGPEGSKSIIARVCVVNNDGNVLLDTHVRPKEKVTDYR